MGGPLDGFEVMDLPSATASRMGQAITAFLDSGNVCMGRRYDDAGQLKRDANNARQWLHYNPKRRELPVRVVKSGDMLILVREEGGE